MTTLDHAMGRVIELKKLEDGWYDGDGLRPRFPADHYAIVFLTDLQVSGPNVPGPHVFPLIEGGYELEWVNEGLSIRIYNDERVEFFTSTINNSPRSYLYVYVSQDFDHYPGYPDMVRWTRDLLDLPQVAYVRD